MRTFLVTTVLLAFYGLVGLGIGGLVAEAFR